MIKWFRYLLCRISTGHGESIVKFEGKSFYLECIRCGWESPGIEVSKEG